MAGKISVTGAVPPEKLQGASNYFEWSRAFRLYVITLNSRLWRAIDGSAPLPENVMDEKLRDQLENARTTATGTILNHVTAQVRNIVDHDMAPDKLWIELRRKFAWGHRMQINNLMRELYTIRMTGDVNEFISSIERISKELAALGEILKPGAKLGPLISGLSDQLRPYSAAFEQEWNQLYSSEDVKRKISASDIDEAVEDIFKNLSRALRDYEDNSRPISIQSTQDMALATSVPMRNWYHRGPTLTYSSELQEEAPAKRRYKPVLAQVLDLR